MAHNHSVHDTDKHFRIIPQTRKIVNASGKKKLMRLDHKSEVFTFDMPRFIDGHDMALCNVLEVHFNNISEDGNTKKPNMDELTIQISPDDENTVIWSWTITENATQLAGILSFFFRFSCVNDDGSVDYNWHTESYDDIMIGDVEYNDQVVIEFYADIIHTWKAEIVAAAVAEVTPIKEAAEEAQRKAEQAQTGAEQSATNAANSEKKAADSEANAKTSEQNASAAATNAGNSEQNAVAAKNSATEAARQAELSRQGAAQSETNAAASAKEAKQAAAEAKGIAVVAKPGQLIIVKEVDENGNPTKWEAVDRTHWVEGGGMTEILPETKLTAPYPEEEPGIFTITTPISLTIGEQCTVNLDGTEYQSTAIDGGVLNSDFAGLPVLMNDGVDMSTGEGIVFLLLVVPPEAFEENGYYAMLQVVSGATELTISIYQGGETIHKLDNKFLNLDWIPSVDATELIAPQTVDRNTSNKVITDFVPTAGQKVAVYFDGIRLPGVVGTDGEKTWITPRGFLGKTANNNHVGDYFSVVTTPYPEEMPDYVVTSQFYLHYTEADGWSVIQGATCLITFTIAVYEETADEIPDVFMPAGFAVPNLRCVYSITESIKTTNWVEEDGYYSGYLQAFNYIPSDAVYCIAIPDTDSRTVANIANIRAKIFNANNFCYMADRLPTADVKVTFYFYALA